MESPCTIEDTPVEVSNDTTKQINDTIDNDDNKQKEIANQTPTSEVTALANTSPTKESRDSIISKKENSSPTKEGRDSIIGKKEKKPKNSTLLIIDPQVDFHFGGTCAIQGADQDSEKIAELIKENIDKIDEIFVTLDSHHRLHIAHSYFWINNAGDSPPPYTEITLEHMDNKTWFPRNEVAHEKSYEYLQALKNGKEGRQQLMIKPEHCLIGTEGHSVVSCINEALQDWAKQRLRKVNYFLKGMNCYTDMNSAFVADVEIPEDPSTFLDPNMLKKLMSREKLVICGQKLSPCLNFTTRDIVAGLNGDLSKIVLVRDGEYNKQNNAIKTTSDQFWEFCELKQIHVYRPTEVFLNQP
jgi:nicotinamidase-related amidase